MSIDSSAASLAIVAETIVAAATIPLMPWCDAVSALLSNQPSPRYIICTSASDESIQVLDPVTLQPLQAAIKPPPGVGELVSFTTMPFCEEFLKAAVSPDVFDSLLGPSSHVDRRRLLVGAGRCKFQIFAMVTIPNENEEASSSSDRPPPTLKLQPLFERQTPMKWPATMTCVDSRPQSIFAACFHTNRLYRVDLTPKGMKWDEEKRNSSEKEEVKKEATTSDGEEGEEEEEEEEEAEKIVANLVKKSDDVGGTAVEVRWAFRVPDASGVVVREHANLVIASSLECSVIHLIDIDTGVGMGEIETSMIPGGLMVLPPSAQRVFFHSCDDDNDDEASSTHRPAATPNRQKEVCISFAYLVPEGGFVPVRWNLSYDSTTNQYGKKKKKVEERAEASAANDADLMEGEITDFAQAPFPANSSGVIMGLMMMLDSTSSSNGALFTNALQERTMAVPTTQTTTKAAEDDTEKKRKEEEQGKCSPPTVVGATTMLTFLVSDSDYVYHRYTCDVERRCLVLEAAKKSGESYGAITL